MGKKPSLLDEKNFIETVIPAYNEGIAEDSLPADEFVARSIIPPGTSAFRDFSYIAPDIPLFHPDQCVGCMDCVTECPDTAILGKVATQEKLDATLSSGPDSHREWLASQWTQTAKYYKTREKKGEEPGLFGIFIDPTKCKGCGECVEVCGSKEALSMIPKDEGILDQSRAGMVHFRAMGNTPKKFINERTLQDMMLDENSLIFKGGAGSCMGCGEVTALRMISTATAFAHGPESMGVVAATGCNTVYCSTYPFNPFQVPWMNSLFENAATTAMGVREMWNRLGHEDKKLWVVGGDGAMVDIGFQAMSRLLTSGMDVNVVILDTQVYSNTGGQASTTSFPGQDAKMSAVGKAQPGKLEHRKEVAMIAMMHPHVYVAQTTAAHPNHFYKAVLRANEFKGPTVLNVYTTCQPEHGVGDDQSHHHAKMAVESRAFPLFEYDPDRGETMRECLTLKGNPSQKTDWVTHPKTGDVFDFIAFARTEGRFAKHFDREGNPSDMLKWAQADRLTNWKKLRDLAGIEI